MKFLLMGSVCVAALTCAHPTSAADIRAPVYKAPPVVFVPYDWSGFYIGGNVGGSVGHGRTQNSVSYFPPGGAAGVTNPISSTSFTRSPDGALGGGQIGYNWQSGNWVFGAEADWDWTGQRDTLDNHSFLASTVVVAPASLNYSDEQRLKWLATARARVGWAQDRWFWFVTGGAAWGKVESTYNFQAASAVAIFASPAAGASFSSTRSGWTVGGGVETSLNNNWSVKLEYLYVDLGTVDNSFTVPVTGTPGNSYTFTSSSRIQDHIIRAGVNYHFGGPAVARSAYASAAPMAVAAYNWSGFYIGGNVGGSVGHDRTRNAVSFFPPGVPGAVAPGVTNPISSTSFTRSPDGALGGGQIGYNWQSGNWIFGAEGDWDWTGQRDTLNNHSFFASTVVVAPASLNYSDEQRLKWLATARARVGWSQDRWLWFVTGGAAWGKVESNYNFQTTGAAGVFASPAVAANFSSTRSGWTIGGGVETSLYNNWSVKLEYLYVDLGTVTNSFTVPVTATPGSSYTFTSSNRIQDHIIRAGVNYRFGG